MKAYIDDPGKVYKLCMSTGNIKEKQPDIELIKSIKNVAERGLEFIKDKAKSVSKDSYEWTFVFRDYYESLRGLVEAYLLFEGITADSHQCKYAYLCFTYKELELNWEFLETIRLKRNAINYRGQLLNYTDWKALQLHFELHINTLKKEIERKIA